MSAMQDQTNKKIPCSGARLRLSHRVPHQPTGMEDPSPASHRPCGCSLLPSCSGSSIHTGPGCPRLLGRRCKSWGAQIGTLVTGQSGITAPVSLEHSWEQHSTPTLICKEYIIFCMLTKKKKCHYIFNSLGSRLEVLFKTSVRHTFNPSKLNGAADALWMAKAFPNCSVHWVGPSHKAEP